MKEHEITLDVRLVFKVPASSETVALARAVVWVQKHVISKEESGNSILKRVGFNLEENLGVEV